MLSIIKGNSENTKNTERYWTITDGDVFYRCDPHTVMRHGLGAAILSGLLNNIWFIDNYEKHGTTNPKNRDRALLRIETLNVLKEKYTLDDESQVLSEKTKYVRC